MQPKLGLDDQARAQSVPATVSLEHAYRYNLSSSYAQKTFYNSKKMHIKLELN